MTFPEVRQSLVEMEKIVEMTRLSRASNLPPPPPEAPPVGTPQLLPVEPAEPRGTLWKVKMEGMVKSLKKVHLFSFF